MTTSVASATACSAVADRGVGRHRLPVAVALTSAFVRSVGFTAALAATDRLPFGLTGTEPLVWAFHLLGFGTAALALTDRVWAWWADAGLTAGYIAVALQLYAVLFVPGLLVAVGWFANDVHIGLAEFLCIRRLCDGS